MAPSWVKAERRSFGIARSDSYLEVVGVSEHFRSPTPTVIVTNDGNDTCCELEENVENEENEVDQDEVGSQTSGRSRLARLSSTLGSTIPAFIRDFSECSCISVHAPT